jgi:NitT/TauT family transport system permease protein
MAVAQETKTIGRNSALINWLKIVLPPLLTAVIVLALWQFEVLHAILNIKTFQLPLPTQIIESAGKRSRDLWLGTNYTLLEAVLGLLIGSAVGFLMALFFVWFDFARRGLMPIAVTTNAIPIIAFVPIMSRWFGFDQPTRIAVVTMMTFAPMVVSAY